MNTINKLFHVNYQNSASGSTYVEYTRKYKKKASRSFIIRFSNHNLKPGNYVSAGVINDETGFSSISVKQLLFYNKYVNSLSTEEYEFLWSNRRINANGVEEFISNE